MRLSNLRKLFIFIALLVTNGFLLVHFNTLLWPYLWPRPLIYVIVAIVVIVTWFPEVLSEQWLFRIVGVAMIFIGQSYWLHSMDVMLQNPSVLSVLHAFGITGIFAVMVLNFVNQFSSRDHTEAPPLPEDLPYVAAVIPTYGEPVEILENTARALLNLEYPSDRLYIFISDDGHRDEVRALTERLGIHYNPGAQKDFKAGNLNSALVHLEEQFPQASLIVTQDADEIIDPTFLQKTVGFFTDPKMGFVQTPKEAVAPDADPFGVRDRVFYDVTQPGRNASGAAFSCGSGVIWRIEAVKSAGGYATWNVVEDLTTSYMIHSDGWKSEYFNEILTVGLAPDDIPVLLKQRGTWATDNWRLFLFKNPLLNDKLTLGQRLQYFELGMFYVTSSLFLPVIMLVPVLSLLSGEFVPIEGSALFPWLIVSLLYYFVFSKGNLSYMFIMLQYWVAHFWTYIKAFSIAIRSRNEKPSYKVTSKTRQAGFYGQLVWVQFLYLLIGTIAIVRGLFFLPDANMISRMTNIGLVTFFMFLVGSICQAAFYGVEIPNIALAGKRLAQRWIPATQPVTQTRIPTGGGD